MSHSIALGAFFFFKWLYRLKAVNEVHLLNAYVRLFEKFEENTFFYIYIYIDSVIILIRISFKNIVFTMGICIFCAFWTWGEQELMLALSEMTIFGI